tara:strand:- start:22 stop:162 length:141 start_codon:yes stop_codon:yes gene_type:complete
MIEIFLETPMELKIILLTVLVMFFKLELEEREQKKKQRGTNGEQVK